MSVRKLKNKLYLMYPWLLKGLCYIDTNAIIPESCKIIGSEIHDKVEIGERTVVFDSIVSGNIQIGSNTTIWGPDIQIQSLKNPIKIGSFCSIARSVTIQEYFHDYNKLSTYYVGRNVFESDVEYEILSKGPIVIGNDVWIGTGAQIMSGVTIGHGAVIAANSTVTRNIPPYAIVGGVPAKVIKFRFSQEVIDELLRIEWWHWDLKKIQQNRSLFSEVLTKELLLKY